MKKISSLIFVLIFCAFFVTGCEEQEVITSGGEEVNVTNMQHKHCTREGTIDTGSQVSLNYDIYYNLSVDVWNDSFRDQADQRMA